MNPVQKGMSDNVAAALAYLTIVPAIIFLNVDPYNQSPLVRFHAFQSLLLCLAGIVFNTALSSLFIMHLGFLALPLLPLSGLVLLGAGIVSAIKAYHGERFRLPVIGDHAARLAGG